MISVTLRDHAPVSQYARQELEHFLNRVYAGPLAGSDSVPADTCRVALEVRPAQPHEVTIEHSRETTIIAGRTPAALLHGVYHFLERFGIVFTAHGPVLPERPAAWPEPFTLHATPWLAERGIRQHLNFPMDITCLPLPQAQEYVRNLARLKLNLLVCHLYPNQGWLRLDRNGYQVGMDPSVTLYYSQRHPLCREPLVRAYSANRETWFIPEFELAYRTPEQHKLLWDWLRAVMRTARDCGMTVWISVESLSPAADASLAAWPEPPGLERYAAATAELACAALEQYPEADGLELISAENESAWPCPTTWEATLAELRREFAIPPKEWPAPVEPGPGEPSPKAAQLLVGAVRQLQVQAGAIARLRADPRAAALLGARPIATALYTTLRQTVNELGPFLRRLVPAGASFALLPAYAAHRTARQAALAGIPPEWRARTRLYSWCEFDGLMYLFQNECAGLHQCVRWARPGEPDAPAALACNHWRTAENAHAIAYLAAAAYKPLPPEQFYPQYFAALAGPAAAAEIAATFRELEQVQVQGVETLFNLGFCFQGWWRLHNISWSPEALARYRDALGAAAARLTRVLPAITRREGLEQVRFWINRLEASQLHCDVVAAWRGLRDLVEWPAGTLPPERREAFRRLAHTAAEQARAYVRHGARWLPDRMSEGVLTSYEYTILGALEQALKEYAGSETSAAAVTDLAGPPAPLGQSET